MFVISCVTVSGHCPKLNYLICKIEIKLIYHLGLLMGLNEIIPLELQAHIGHFDCSYTPLHQSDLITTFKEFGIWEKMDMLDTLEINPCFLFLGFKGQFMGSWFHFWILNIECTQTAYHSFSDFIHYLIFSNHLLSPPFSLASAAAIWKQSPHMSPLTKWNLKQI